MTIQYSVPLKVAFNYNCLLSNYYLTILVIRCGLMKVVKKLCETVTFYIVNAKGRMNKKETK